MGKIRVLHFYKTSLPATIGGVEVFMDTLCNATADLNIDNIVLSLSKHPSNEPICMSKYSVVQVKQNLFIASTGFSLSAFTKFRHLAATANIIHYHFPNPFADLLHFACRINKPAILTYHSDIIKQKRIMTIYKPLMHHFLDSMNKIIATSPNYFATSDILQKYKTKVETIPIGLSKNSMPLLNQARLDYWMKRLPKKFFLFIGAMRYYKGLHIALEAVKNTDLQLVLAGLGSIEYELKDTARQNNINNVHFLGSITEEDKIALLHLSYAFVFPSNLRSEAFGISLVEAASMQKPLISCEIGTGTSFVNIDQETGLVIQPSSPDALRNAMRFLLDNPDKANEFGLNAKKRYWQLFTAEKQAQAYARVYREILGYES